VIAPSSPKITGIALTNNGATVALTFTSIDQFDTSNSYNLQVSTNLASTPHAGFTNVAGAVFGGTFGVTNGTFTVLIPTNGPASFFRLQHQ
jgi:hypothetical protein